jgi:L-alanine-DL-glutamate epimerase-like enolase superfamily enzyme
MDRRAFLQTVSITGVGLSLFHTLSAQTTGKQATYSASSRINEYLKDPVVIDTIELLQWKKQFFVVVTDTNGLKGITLCNARIAFLSGIFNGLVVPFFIQKDARGIEVLIHEVYKEERNYKFSGMPFWNCAGHIEVAIWDLLGKKAGVPVHTLLGTKKRNELPMYLSSLTRNNEAAAEVNELLAGLEKTGCKAVKVKVGGRMGTDTKAEQRSYDIVKLLRSKASPDLTIYADANSSFDVKQGIAMGRFLEDNGVDIFEEPCPWEDFESNRKVNKALKKIRIAGGEQDTSYFRFEWYVKNNGLDVLQPDVFYNGGIVRTLSVANLCSQYNKFFAPHSPKADPLEAPFLHLMAVAPNIYGYQEFPLSGAGKKQENWWGPHFELSNGILKIPDNPGLGIEYDPTIFKEAVKF